MVRASTQKASDTKFDFPSLKQEKEEKSMGKKASSENLHKVHATVVNVYCVWHKFEHYFHRSKR